MYHSLRPAKADPTRPPPRRHASHRRASAAVELAILLPFLGLMFTAAVDFGRIFYVTQTLDACACSGAMYASGTAWAPSSQGRNQAAVQAACAGGASLSPPLEQGNVTVTSDDAAGTVTVTVAYDFELLTPVLGSTGPLHLTRTVTMHAAPIPGS